VTKVTLQQIPFQYAEAVPKNIDEKSPEASRTKFWCQC